MGERDRFPASHEWKRYMDRMSDEQCGRFWRAIYAYQMDGVIYDGDDPVVGIAFDACLEFMDNCKAKYEETCERNRANGAKGGRPKKQKKQETENPVGFLGPENSDNENPTITQTKPRKPDTDTDTDTDTVDNTATPLTRSTSIISFPEPAVDTLRDPKLAQVIQYYQRMISPDMSRQTVEQLKMACEEWDAEVVLRAIDAAIDAGKRNGSYVCGILRGFRRDGIRTVEDALRKDEQHRLDREREQAQRESRQARHAPAQVLQPSGNRYLPADDLAYLFEDTAGTPQEGSP